VPNAETLVRKAEEKDLDLDFANTDEEKRELEESKAGLVWRLLRVASKSKLNQFEKLDDTGNLKILHKEEDGDAEESKQDNSNDPEVLGDVDSSTNVTDPIDLPLTTTEARPPVTV
jgi:THO complex subunit 1